MVDGGWWGFVTTNRLGVLPFSNPWAEATLPRLRGEYITNQSETIDAKKRLGCTQWISLESCHFDQGHSSLRRLPVWRYRVSGKQADTYLR